MTSPDHYADAKPSQRPPYEDRPLSQAEAEQAYEDAGDGPPLPKEQIDAIVDGVCKPSPAPSGEHNYYAEAFSMFSRGDSMAPTHVVVTAVAAALEARDAKHAEEVERLKAGAMQIARWCKGDYQNSGSAPSMMESMIGGSSMGDLSI